MIDLKKLRELIKLMSDNDLTEIELRDKEEGVTIKRGSVGQPVVQHVAPAPAPAPAQAAAAPTNTTAVQGDSPPADDGLVPIRSPMVGTFYAASSPDAEDFVAAGAQVSDETVVCIIEAMKVFNEIKAECKGRIERILVENGQAVEFDQPLFMVRPG